MTDFYFLGVDTAPAQKAGADDGAFAILRARLRFQPRLPEPGTPEVEEEIIRQSISDYALAAVYARKHRNLSTRQWSGNMAHLHQRFRLSYIVMDPGGGGLYVKKDLLEPRQWIEGVETESRAIATMDEVAAPIDAERILSLFQRGDKGIEAIWPGLPADDNLVDAAHVSLREALAHGHLALPKPAREWTTTEVAGWPEEKQFCLRCLDEAADQLRSVRVQTDAEGTWLMTKHNARRFSAKGKKDVAYCILYAWVAFRIWLATRLTLGAYNSDDGHECATW
jgi:hypothetical protein